MPALRTNFRGVVGLLLHLSNVSLSSFDASILIVVLAMPPLSHGKKTYSSYFRDWALVYHPSDYSGVCCEIDKRDTLK
jgi:hypothetical protein